MCLVGPSRQRRYCAFLVNQLLLNLSAPNLRVTTHETLQDSLLPACPRYCMECKRLLDRLYHQARNQGQQSWWHSTRSDEKATRDMLNHYRTLINDNPSSNKKVRFSVAEFKEVVKRQQRQSVIQKGRMMWVKQAVEYWMTTPGGSYSLEAAEASCLATVFS